MVEVLAVEEFLKASHVDQQVIDLRPDYRALLLVVDGLVAGPSSEASHALLQAAEKSARLALEVQPVEEIAHVAAWREAYRSFGAKPQRTRNSLEALIRRAETGLPRVNALTDVYNAISVIHQVPLGGEDFSRYSGSPKLIRATGIEPFDIMAEGQEVLEYPEVGEVVWADEAGVTCRRWNWRQGRRTSLRDETSTAFFILDALEPMTNDELETAADELASNLQLLGPSVTVARRLISSTHAN